MKKERTPAEEVLFRIVLMLDTYGGGDSWTRSAEGAAARFRQSGIEYDPSGWMDRALGLAEKKRFSRALDELEQAELIVRVAYCGRTTHVQPTPAGLKKALGLTPDADLARVAAGLALAEWAPEELQDVVSAVAKRSRR